MSATFIQWKGTEVCMDFNCPECGKQSHFDGGFAYFIECPYCCSVFELGTEVTATKVERGACKPLRSLSAEDD